MGARSEARECALKVLYQKEITGLSPQEVLGDYFSFHKHSPSVEKFSKTLVEGVCNYLEDIDKVIKKYAENWDISRMAIIDKNILRIGTFELLYIEDIPPKVSINEAVELAKKYGDIDSPRFVNGILDTIFRRESKKTLEDGAG